MWIDPRACRSLEALVSIVIAVALAPGCVRRTLTITTEPAGALIVLNDEEVGYSPISRDFTWYGDYDVIVRKPGYETLKTHHILREPWYQIPPIDFFAEVLYPGWIHDTQEATFSLTPRAAPDRDALIQRSEQLRQSAHRGETPLEEPPAQEAVVPPTQDVTAPQ